MRVIPKFVHVRVRRWNGVWEREYKFFPPSLRARLVGAVSCTAFYTDVYKMASLVCECGDEFRAQCDEHTSSLSLAWVLLVAYVALHMLYVCTRDDSDDDECESTMYS